jgi:hypothetical protein
MKEEKKRKGRKEGRTACAEKQVCKSVVHA